MQDLIRRREYIDLHLTARSTEVSRRVTGAKFDELFPDEGPLRRELYPKHLEFFRAGRDYRERCARCANRIGKTWSMGGYETTCHLTGKYPKWWEGRVFEHPIDAWAVGKTNQTTRDIVQKALFGGVKRRGTGRVLTGDGLVPAGLMGAPSWYSAGAKDLVDVIPVRHVSGGWSQVGFKSYQQKRGAFEGTARHLVWMDEEPPLDIYAECLVRTMTTQGIIMITFTPKMGMSETVLQFMPEADRPPM